MTSKWPVNGSLACLIAWQIVLENLASGQTNSQASSKSTPELISVESCVCGDCCGLLDLKLNDLFTAGLIRFWLSDGKEDAGGGEEEVKRLGIEQSSQLVERDCSSLRKAFDFLPVEPCSTWFFWTKVIGSSDWLAFRWSDWVARFVLFRGELFTGFVRLARLFNELFVNRCADGELVGEFDGELLDDCGEW